MRRAIQEITIKPTVIQEACRGAIPEITIEHTAIQEACRGAIREITTRPTAIRGAKAAATRVTGTTQRVTRGGAIRGAALIALAATRSRVVFLVVCTLSDIPPAAGMHFATRVATGKGSGDPGIIPEGGALVAIVQVRVQVRAQALALVIQIKHERQPFFLFFFLLRYLFVSSVGGQELWGKGVFLGPLCIFFC